MEREGKKWRWGSDLGPLYASVKERRGSQQDNNSGASQRGGGRAIERSQGYFRRCQYPEGYWCGQLESNTTMEAEYLMLSLFLGRVDRERWRKLTNLMLSKQQEDGSWGQYYEAPGDLSTSVECYFALKLAGYPADSPPLQKARRLHSFRRWCPQSAGFHQNLAGPL